MNLTLPFHVTIPVVRPLEGDSLRLAYFAIDDARGYLLDYAQTGDTPPPCVVDVADQLDDILEVLSGEVSP